MSDVLYAQADDGTNIAYRVLEAGPSAEPVRDVVMVPGGLIPLELFEGGALQRPGSFSAGPEDRSGSGRYRAATRQRQQYDAGQQRAALRQARHD